jgi:hypothetical protein
MISWSSSAGPTFAEYTRSFACGDIPIVLWFAAVPPLA